MERAKLAFQLHADPMGYLGARSKSTDTWLLPPDEDRFGELVADLSPDARWRCSHPGPADKHPKHVHLTIAEAMRCGGTQVFLTLPIGTDPFNDEPGAQVQLLRSRIRDDEYGRYFHGGRLATGWFEGEVGPDMHALLSAQRDLVWQVLRKTTSPAHIEKLDGRHVSGKRIGPEALNLTRAEGLLLSPMAGWPRYRLAD